MEKLNLNEMRELNGKLVGLSDESVVDVECLELWAGHRKKLSQVLEKGLVTRDTQEYMVDTLIIKIAGKDTFEKGQSSWVKDGNTYSLSTKPRNPKRFKGQFVTIAPHINDSNYLFACEVNLGNIEFDLSNCVGTTINDDEIMYQKVPMILYPYGVYSFRVVDDE